MQAQILSLRPDIKPPTAKQTIKHTVAAQNAAAASSTNTNVDKLFKELSYINPDSGKGVPVTLLLRTRPNQQEFEAVLEHEVNTPFLRLHAGSTIKVDPFVTCLVCPKDYDPWSDTTVTYDKATDWLISEEEFSGQWELFGFFNISATGNGAFLCNEAYRICD